ncbi:transketolase family protein [Natranaerobius thermophilus]|uniref:Transketolase subunit B n=1 Tax=Natranaerobius thermophilus (strain ATCC BAA-1301 / DSM 18059 / JW/NM-WN-LF) TaxID=457570 RepID=B2A807_NATTJ|nr:transketolase family protein [Natranaerobius thermophilus]ACB85779.1 transketolase subunit B [Natranaerobius thermophilus JW/NM-WN-LF]
MANIGEKIPTRKAYGETLIELGQERSDIVVLDADLSKSTKTAGFQKEFPERFFNVGISEADLMGTAAGFATTGKTVFASTFAIFATGRAYDQVRNSICYPKLNVKIAATHCGLTVGEDGASHQMLEDMALMRALPNMKVMVPADATSARALVKEAASFKGPCYIRLGRPGVPVIYEEGEQFTIGQGKLLKKGEDVTIVACGHMVERANKAAEELKEQGISAEVLDMYSVKPIDKQLIIDSAKKTGAVVTAEEHNMFGGLGEAVASVLTEKCPVPLRKVAVNDTFGESGKAEDLMDKYGLTSQDIVEQSKNVIKFKQS